MWIRNWFIAWPTVMSHSMSHYWYLYYWYATVSWLILEYANVFWRILTYTDVWWRSLTYVVYTTPRQRTAGIISNDYHRRLSRLRSSRRRGTSLWFPRFSGVIFLKKSKKIGPSYCYICVLIILYMCPHTVIFMSSATTRDPSLIPAIFPGVKNMK